MAILTNWFGYCEDNFAMGTLTSAGLKARDSFEIVIQATDVNGHNEYMCYPGPSNTGSITEFCDGSAYGGSGNAWTDMVDGTHVTTANIYVGDSSGRFIGSATASQ